MEEPVGKRVQVPACRPRVAQSWTSAGWPFSSWLRRFVLVSLWSFVSLALLGLFARWSLRASRPEGLGMGYSLPSSRR